MIEKIFRILAEDNPTPETELYYTNAFTLLVAVALSAQATDIGVNKATKTLFQIVQTPEDLLHLGLEAFRESIKTIGLYNTKAKNIYRLAEILIEKHHSIVPSTREDLEALPGVGRKTANVVLNIAFGQDTLAVDTHIYRLARRLGLSDGTTPLAVEKDLEKIIPNAYKHHAHHWLILHGRYICKAQKPRCQHCKIAMYCPSRISY
jgi:endonuclease-3